ncbi:protein-L-isoaspartate(D-aspartate) O-methyltransferase [Alcanivorax xiamenensis]|nr:protein-L-isoaspartate(D-aspartate) O-methyltransferase [Alcanivorax xiamenensis]
MTDRRSGIGMTSARTRERLISRLRESGITDERVLEAIRATPRHLFVDEALSHQAYDDTALPIGHGQTISQPWVVARMTELLIEQSIPEKVLEVGTGCGYQTAVLAAFARQVCSVERIRPLQDAARVRLRELGLANRVQLRHADGGFGWSSAAPFDGILVTCARPDIPEELLAQLAEGGRLVMPVGDRQQRLTVVDRNGNELVSRALDPVRFVPFQRGVQ